MSHAVRSIQHERAFTLIEVMAVVALVGILAAGTAWSLAGSAQRANQSDVIDQLRHLDERARIAGRRLGPSTLCFDLDRQRVWINSPAERAGKQASGHRVELGPGYRVDRMVWVDPATTARAGRTLPRQVIRAENGVVEIPIASTGVSRTYAVALTGADPDHTQAGRGSREMRTVWLVFSGLTGQVMLDENDEVIDELLQTLARPRPDAD